MSAQQARAKTAKLLAALALAGALPAGAVVPGFFGSTGQDLANIDQIEVR